MSPFQFFVNCSWYGFIFSLLMYFFFYSLVRGLHYLDKI